MQVSKFTAIGLSSKKERERNIQASYTTLGALLGVDKNRFN
jgi:hypothetical protein